MTTNCTVCGKELEQKRGKRKSRSKTGLCITCFNIKRNTNQRGEKSPSWKGGTAAYGSLHKWVRRRFQRPQFCEICKIGFPIDLANISQKYKRELSDWEWLCRRCHMVKDGRIKQDAQEKHKRPATGVLKQVRTYQQNYRRNRK